MKAQYKLSGRFPVVIVSDTEGEICLDCGSSDEKRYTERPILCERVARVINESSDQAARIVELEQLLEEAKTIIREKNAKIMELKNNKGIAELEAALRNICDNFDKTTYANIKSAVLDARAMLEGG